MITPAVPKSWYLPSKPHKFCPGCGHGIVLKALGETIDELEIQDKTIFGCDIGCSLLSWDFFACDSTQTHHGRTTPVMVGIKRARPELITIGYMGDGGGYSIGSIPFDTYNLFYRDQLETTRLAALRAASVR